jgi:uncharacterized protein
MLHTALTKNLIEHHTRIFNKKVLLERQNKFNNNMASGFFAILDDIAALMDDVAINAKLATQKTAGILGDDLAVNAEKSTGFVSSREIPVLWAITKGSFINKLIIVPVTLLLNIFLPAAIIVILVLGGFYLAFERVEKIAEYLFHKKESAEQAEEEVKDDTKYIATIEKWEKEKTAVQSAFTDKVNLLKEELTVKYFLAKQTALDDYPIFIAITEDISDINYYAPGRNTNNNELTEIEIQLSKIIAHITKTEK